MIPLLLRHCNLNPLLGRLGFDCFSTILILALERGAIRCGRSRGEQLIINLKKCYQLNKLF